VIFKLTLLVWGLIAGVTVVCPGYGRALWTRLGRWAGTLRNHPGKTCLGIATTVLLTRLLLIPFWPIPLPVIYDEFGYLLQADTFSNLRLTNPPHPHWTAFESIFVLQQPTYNAKFPPGQGLAMAFGEILFGHPWYGVWLSCGALAAVLYWSLLAWLPARWALLGVALSLKACLFGYWMNSYWGGALTATGGALLLGTYGRITRKQSAGSAWLLGLGLAFLGLTRPFEGTLLALVVLPPLLWHTRAIQIWLPIVLVNVAAIGFLAFHNHRVTGNFARLPYLEYQRQYSAAPFFNFLSLPPVPPQYHHRNLERLHRGWEMKQWQQSRSWEVVPQRLANWWSETPKLLGDRFNTLVLAAFLGFSWNVRRTRIATVGAAVIFVASFVEIVFYAHYASPFHSIFLLLTVQAYRYFRVWSRKFFDAGLFLAGAIPAASLVLLVADQAAQIYRQLPIEQTQPINARRLKIEDRLCTDLKNHLIFVQYTGSQLPHEEWIYNRADIDAAPVVWAQDQGPAANEELVRYFKNRRAWLFRPDVDPEKLTPYP